MLRHKANMEDGYRMQYSFIAGDTDITSEFSCDISDILRLIRSMVCNNQDFFKITTCSNMSLRVIETFFSY